MTNCAWCGHKIPETEEHYQKYGHCCIECDSIFNKMEDGERGLVIKNGRMEWRIIRKYTISEKDAIFMEYMLKKA